MKKKRNKRSSVAFALSLVAVMGIGILQPALCVSAAEPSAKYYASFSSQADAKAAAEELTKELASEGDILLKNDNKTLPLSGSEWISVFGVRSDNLIGASDSDGAWSSDSSGSESTVAAALEDAGFNVNPTLKQLYANDSSSIGNEIYSFSGQIQSSVEMYNDAAVLVLSREGGEGSDASTTTAANGMVETVGDDDTHKALAVNKEGQAIKHSLMLTNSERELVAYLKKNFSKIIIVLNTSNAMEVAELQNDDAISAIIDIGRPGVGGLDALAAILNGKVNPSGGLVDEWMTDFTADPVWYNFGSNNQNNIGGLAGSNTYLAENDATSISDSDGYHGVDYEESIYLGYKYYETYYYDLYHGVYNGGTESEATHAEAQDWWAANVTYPFGYGLSYTSFSFNASEIYTDVACTKALGKSVDASAFNSSVGSYAEIEKIYVPVTVKNTGDMAGKKTVQAYVSAPYTKGGIEKAAVSLVGFAKTDILQPGESQTVVIEINVEDMASWDYADANGDGFKGDYELDGGAYTIRFMENSHFDCATDVSDSKDAYAEVTFTLNATAHLQLDDYSHNELSNVFSEENGVWDENTVDGELAFNNIRTADMMADGKSGMTMLSRVDMVATFPQAPTVDDLTFKDNILSNWGYWDNYTMSDKSIDRNGNEVTETTALISDESAYPWYKTESDIPDNWTQATGKYDPEHTVQITSQTGSMANIRPIYVSSAEDNTIKFSDMSGVDYDDELWDKFLNQLTYDELCLVVEQGGYATVELDSVGKARGIDYDGPNNLNSFHCWCSEDIIASTWNVNLSEKEGSLMGDIALLQNIKGWYGPGTDTHRSPFSGRNNEYYAQDGFLAGNICAAVVKGASSKGIITYVKHCFMNDQETNRGNLFTWCDEQAIRENYCKSFQVAFQEGESAAAMTGYGRLAGLSNTNNYNMSTELFQNQWGVEAYFVTDGYIGWASRTDLDMMVRTGHQMELYTTPFVEYLSGSWDANNNMVVIGSGDNAISSPTQWYCVRESAKSILYQTANSAVAENGYTLLSVADAEISAVQGVSFEGSIAIDEFLGEGSSYNITIDGSVPEGITIDGMSGAISGKSVNPGEYAFTATYVIDGYVTKTANYVINVASAFELDPNSDDITAAKSGKSLFALITSSVFTTEGGAYDSVTYSVKNGALPDGVSLGENGTIEGTPTASGTYEVVIEATATKTVPSFFGTITESETCDYKLTFVVEGESEIETNVSETAEGADTVVTTETESKTSSGSVIALVFSIIALVGVAGIAVYVILTGKKKDNK